MANYPEYYHYAPYEPQHIQNREQPQVLHHAEYHPSSSSTFMRNTNCPGGNPGAKSYYVPSASACRNRCLTDPSCSLWTYSHTNQQCRLKNEPWPAMYDPLYTSGYVSRR